MPEPGPTSSSHAEAIPIPVDLRHAAARRLVQVPAAERDEAARRLLRVAPAHGIDLDLIFGVPGPDGDVLEACLAVPAAGRTAMLYVSAPVDDADGGPGHSAEVSSSARAAAVTRALTRLKSDERVKLVQALPAPEEPWAEPALIAGGMRAIADLSYLRAPLPLAGPPAPAEPEWPAGFSVERLASKRRHLRPAEHRDLAQALQASYEDTLDCPELCGIREIGDVIDSHRSTGVFDPASWWLVRHEGEPIGCCLLSNVPAQRTLELVYIGLGRVARGKGIAPRLLAFASQSALRTASGPPTTMTCAVDERNGPAMRIYERFGFDAFTRRCALICPL